MSPESADPDAVEPTVPDSLRDALPPKAHQLGAYLLERLDTEKELYVKSRFIAENVDLSSKEVGWYLRELQETTTLLHVEQWAYTNGTTWRITREGSSSASASGGYSGRE